MCNGYWRGQSTRTIYLNHQDRLCMTAKARRDRFSSFTYSSMIRAIAFIGADCLSRIRMGPYVRYLKPRYCSGKMRFRVWLEIFKLGSLKFLEMLSRMLLQALTKGNRLDWHKLQKVSEIFQYNKTSLQIMILLRQILKKKWCFLMATLPIKSILKQANIHEYLSIKVHNKNLKRLKSMIKPN